MNYVINLLPILFLIIGLLLSVDMYLLIRKLVKVMIRFFEQKHNDDM
jgi:hypothetical protein